MVVVVVVVVVGVDDNSHTPEPKLEPALAENNTIETSNKS